MRFNYVSVQVMQDRAARRANVEHGGIEIALNLSFNFPAEV